MSADNDDNHEEFCSTQASMFEIIQFGLKRNLADGRCLNGIYGVNVAKVREVIRMPKINPLAARIEGIEGVFELRNIPIPAINLCTVLGDAKSDLNDEQQIIVVEVAGKRAGFIVSSTHRIRRVNWSNVLPPSADDASCMTGMILIEDNEFLFILDLERILATLDFASHNSPIDKANETYRQVQATPVRSNGINILLADDSSFMLNSISSELKKAGFNVITAENGLKALEVLESTTERIDIIVTDIEMPQLDGLGFTARLKKDAKYAAIPVLLHSSLAENVMKVNGDKVGADGYVVKGDINNLLDAVSEITLLKKTA